MDLKTQLQKDIVAAMKAGDDEKRNALRMLTAAIKQVEVDGGHALSDAEVLEVLLKQAKQRRESIADYEKAERDDLAAEERRELQYIEAYLPQQMSEAEIRAAAQAVIAELGVDSMRGMGQVMGRLTAELKGQADGRVISQIVRSLLQS